MYLNKTVLHVNILSKTIHGSHMDWKNGETFSSQGNLPKILLEK